MTRWQVTIVTDADDPINIPRATKFWERCARSAGHTPAEDPKVTVTRYSTYPASSGEDAALHRVEGTIE